MTNDNLSISDVINQPGGSMQISYGDFGIVAPTNDVHKAIALLKRYKTELYTLRLDNYI